MDEEAIFISALEMASADMRAAYLDQACAGNSDLRRQVEELLAAHGQAGDYLDKAAAAWNAYMPIGDQQARAEQPGTVIGPYKLLEQIGEGGFGIVFMAEQTQPVRRKVALKVLKPGMDTRQVVARFEAERQALALMDHPHIAKVHDGGATPSGRPYFVMELVKGVPITDFCDRNQLTPRQRLELFVSVCQAVQHAHQKGIIHRDLKPSNVLVTVHDTRPVVKVIDFGVAKALGQELTDKTLFTGFAQMIGTPLYMSPEQAGQSGLDIDTRTDVYALGVLLYELLTGTTPFDSERLRTAGFDELRRIIREEEPPRPSTRISTLGQAAATVSDNRKSDPKRLSQLFRGELDWIVMKALEKDRNRRYESASAFAADVQRYLHDEPVQACPPSTWYRFRKFARRNKAVLVTAAVVALAALGLLVAVLYHNAVLRRATQTAQDAAQTAQEKKRLARRAVDEMYTEVAEQWLALEPHRKEAQRHFLLKALAFYEEFAREQSADPSVRLEAARACERAGNIHRMLGQHGPAEQAYRQALERLQQLTADFPNDPLYRRQLGSSWNELGVVLSATRRHEEAEHALRQALDIGEKLEAEFLDSPDYQHDLASTHNNLAILLKSVGRLPEAEQTYRRSIQRRQKLVDDSPNNPIYLKGLAENLHNLGILLALTGRPREAEQCYRQALETFQKLAADFPIRPEYRDRLGNCLGELALVLMNTGRPQEGEEMMLQGMEVYEKLVADFPTVPDYRYHLAVGYNNLGGLRHNLGRAREAEPALRRALDLRLKLHADFPADPDHRLALVSTHDNLGGVLSKLDRLPEAEQAHRQALSIAQQLADDFPAVPAYQKRLATVGYNLACHLVDTNRPEQAEQTYRLALDRLERLAADFPAVPEYQHLLGGTLHNLGNLPHIRTDPTKARPFFERALQHQQRAFETNPKHPGFRQFLGLHYGELAEVLVELGEHAEAAKTAAEVPRLYPDSWQECHQAATHLARCVPLAEKDAQLTEDQRRTLAQAYADQAVARLREAVAKGCTDPAQLTKPAAFDPLRGRADFQELVRTLEDKAKMK
jgi:serine/threonine protein kinase